MAQGPLGIVLVVTGWVAWSKDKELKSERDARIADAKEYNKLSLDLQAQVMGAVDKLSDILDESMKQRGNR